MGPQSRKLSNWLKKRRQTDDAERGAELIEFAFVVVLLIALLYGIVTYGLILAAQSTITSAAADAARAGLVASSTAQAVTAAQGQAGTDLGWLNKGACGTAGTTITCVATTEACPSNSAVECLKVTVVYNYSSSPLFPELPGMGIVTPSTISSTSVVQMAAAS
ncbi:MAG TPA: TadE/TadG family type IV pilus assembly protein [Acidimicrobiales bacterium]